MGINTKISLKQNQIFYKKCKIVDVSFQHSNLVKKNI